MAEYWCSFKRVSTQLYRGIDQALSSSWRPESWYADPKVFFSHILKRHPPIMLIFELICNWSPVGYDKVIYDRLQGTLKIERPIYFFLLESDSSKQTNATARLKKIKLSCSLLVGKEECKCGWNCIREKKEIRSQISKRFPLIAISMNYTGRI